MWRHLAVISAIGPGCGDVRSTPDAWSIDAAGLADAASNDAGALDGGLGGICESGATTQSPVVDQCLSEACCPSYDTCRADSDCLNCLTGAATGCETNGLYAAFAGCAESACPANLCQGPLFWADDDGQPRIPCHQCINQTCCAPLQACLVGDPPTDQQLQECSACLNNDASCLNAIRPSAEAFLSCASDNCAVQCGL